jgi:hypothetical protein
MKDNESKNKLERLHKGKSLDRAFPYDVNLKLDTDGLSDDEVKELTKERAQMMIKLEGKANNLVIENKVIDQNLASMINHTAKAGEDGTAITITRKLKDEMGETEVIMGNTETARKGKLSKEYNQIYYIVGAIVLLVALYIIFQ